MESKWKFKFVNWKFLDKQELCDFNLMRLRMHVHIKYYLNIIILYLNMYKEQTIFIAYDFFF